jgi:hypothetical protein
LRIGLRYEDLRPVAPPRPTLFAGHGYPTLGTVLSCDSKTEKGNAGARLGLPTHGKPQPNGKVKAGARNRALSSGKRDESAANQFYRSGIGKRCPLIWGVYRPRHRRLDAVGWGHAFPRARKMALHRPQPRAGVFPGVAKALRAGGSHQGVPSARFSSARFGGGAEGHTCLRGKNEPLGGRCFVHQMRARFCPWPCELW